MILQGQAKKYFTFFLTYKKKTDDLTQHSADNLLSTGLMFVIIGIGFRVVQFTGGVILLALIFPFKGIIIPSEPTAIMRTIEIDMWHQFHH